MWMPPQERRNLRREQVENCLSSPMTIEEWCRLNRVSESTMYRWMAIFRDEEPELFGKANASQWIELSRGAIAAQTALAIAPGAEGVPVAAPVGEAVEEKSPSAPIIVRVNGAEVAVPAGSDDAHITSVLKAVARL